MNKIIFGPAGSGGAKPENFIKLKKLGLGACELEFVYSIWLNKEQSQKIKELNKKLNLKLSIHAPYYINLNSEDKTKIGASCSRILKCLEIANILSNGEKIPVVFHPGFYLKKTKEETYKIIKEQIEKIMKEAKERGWSDVILAAETTGKSRQFGDLDEILSLMKDTGCGICVDFSHLKARYNGKINYDEVMEKIKNIKNLHAHFSGINFGEKGEKNHILTGEKEIKELFHYLKKHNINCAIINESPDPLADALKMKKIWGERKF
jgi:deoxyribonuclease-4